MRFLMLTLLMMIAANAERTALTTVPYVDLQRYLGTWYEIARYPNRFEKNCVAEVTATYSLRADGKIQVVNACRRVDGSHQQAKGWAKVVDKSSNAKLKVTFFWPLFGNYWIIDLDANYTYAVISEPGREYLWILSRTPQMDPAQYNSIVEQLRARGFDPGKLIKPIQTRV